MSSNKKVLISRFERESLAGFVNPATYLLVGGVEFLSVTGTVLIVPYHEIKTVAFVRDFPQVEPKQEVRSFTTRPKMEGLWIRMRFRDGDWLDGVLTNNLLLLDGLGFTVVPPGPGNLNQRLFIPKAAVTQVQVLGVVGSPLRPARPKAPTRDQIELFEKG